MDKEQKLIWTDAGITAQNWVNEFFWQLDTEDCVTCPRSFLDDKLNESLFSLQVAIDVVQRYWIYFTCICVASGERFYTNLSREVMENYVNYIAKHTVDEPEGFTFEGRFYAVTETENKLSVEFNKLRFIDWVAAFRNYCDSVYGDGHYNLGYLSNDGYTMDFTLYRFFPDGEPRPTHGIKPFRKAVAQ